MIYIHIKMINYLENIPFPDLTTLKIIVYIYLNLPYSIIELSKLCQGDEDGDNGIESTKMLVSTQTPSQKPVPG